MINYKLTPTALKLRDLGICNCAPVRATPGSAGADLRICLTEEQGERVTILPYQTVKLGTGVAVWLGPAYKSVEGLFTYAGLILPRSSISGLQLENTVGLLDSDYQGELFLKLYNKTEESITIRQGERVAQLVIIPTLVSPWFEVAKFYSQTLRGEGGDGSTGTGLGEEYY